MRSEGALSRPPEISVLTDHASRLPGVPAIRLTVHETDDIEGDVAFLRRLRLTLEEHVGANLVVVTIRTLDGCRVRAEWRAMAEPGLRRRLAEMLGERAKVLGLLVNRRVGDCRCCGGRDLAYDTHGRLGCRPCREGAKVLSAERVHEDERAE